MTSITDRFLKYVSFHTTSDENSGTTPSFSGELVLAEYIKQELTDLGMQDVDLDANGYIMATLPANTDIAKPTIGFIAHLDTSPDASGKDIKPQIVRDYNGEDIILNSEKGIRLETNKYPDILRYKGQDIIVTNGTTLLGADDKAGIAEIVTAMEYLIEHPEIKHGKIRIGFTPDEEIGQGADHFHVKKFAADWAYTMDGGTIGELEFENFNAASAKITINGINVHPGAAYNKMKNAMLIAADIIEMLPKDETPSTTRNYEGFYHLVGMQGTVENATLSYIIRDHDRQKFEHRKQTIEKIVAQINCQYGEGTAEAQIRDQYYNMREKIEPVMHVVELAEKAMRQLEIEPKVQPIRGGTDGARLSFEGLPCPNIFAGGENFHSRFEYLPIPSLQKAMQVILKIIELA